MMDLSAEVDVALAGTATIPKEQYERWIRGDLRTRARVYALAESQWSRIHPEPSGEQHCRFMADYLIECVLRNPAGDAFLHSGFDAAREMAAWLKHLATFPGGEAMLGAVEGRLALAYKAADAATRNRIETGALEHALESPAVRPFFDSWAIDPILRDAHERALAWGLAHPEHAGDETLEQLESEDWGEPPLDSDLVRTVHALRRKPIREFTVEDLRLTLGQKFGMEFLTPLALDQLEADPFAEGRFYPGDLLVAVMGMPRHHWSVHPHEASRMSAIAARVQAELNARDEIQSIKEKIWALLTKAAWHAS